MLGSGRYRFRFCNDLSHAAQWQEGRLLFELIGTCHAILKAAGIRGMAEHLALLKEQKLPIPKQNPNPKVVVQNTGQVAPAA